MARPPTISNEAILAAARQVFLEQGYGASTLDIAERAGISEASIFKRFGTKQGLFLAAMGVYDPPSWIQTLTPPTPTTDLKADLTAICQQILAFQQETLSRVMMVMAQGNLPNPPMPPPSVRDSRVLAEYLEAAIALGLARPCDATTLAHLLVGAIMNYVIADQSAQRFPGSPDLPAPIAPDHFVASLIDALWTGIDPQP